MRLPLLATVALLFVTHAAQAEEWKVQKIDAPARVMTVESSDNEVRVNAGGLLYRVTFDGTHAGFSFIGKAPDAEKPAGDMRVKGDFDNDSVEDVAMASDDRATLRLLKLWPQQSEIAVVPLPAKAATDLALIKLPSGQLAIALGLDDGSLAIVRHTP